MSFKSYAKVNEAEQVMLEAHRRQTRKRITIIALSSIVLVAVVVAAVVGTTTARNNGGSSNKNNGRANKSYATIKAICDTTLYQESCYRTLGPLVNSTQVQPAKLFNLSVLVALKELSKATEHFFEHGTFGNITEKMSVEALKNCGELMGLAMDSLNSSLLASGDDQSLFEAVDDLKTWLSSSRTSYQTCIDGLEEANKESLVASVESYLKNSTELTSNSLAIVTWISKIASYVNLRRLLSIHSHGVPEWLHHKDRKLLESSNLRKSADIVVAKDGSGKYKTVGEALKSVPHKSKKRIVIYVKKGVYNETVKVEKSKWNVVMVGDGMKDTIVSGGLNFVDGTPTFSTATFGKLSCIGSPINICVLVLE